MEAAAKDLHPAPGVLGPTRLARQADEPDWLCDGAFRDEHGRTWLCGRIKHDGTAHQSWLYIDGAGAGHQVAHAERLEWRDW
jgi:hypothetical protein